MHKWGDGRNCRSSCRDGKHLPAQLSSSLPRGETFQIAAREAAGPQPHNQSQESAPIQDGRRAQNWALLVGNRDFWRLWLVGLILFVVRWLEMLAMAVFVYHRTDSAFLVALLTMLRLLPMSLFGAFLGAAADRLERHLALALMVLAQLGTSLALLMLAHTDQLQVWHLAVASFVNGIGWTADNPVRRVMIGEVVGVEAIGTAMAIDVGTNNASRILGPTAGGLLLAGFGMEGVFALSVALAVSALMASITIRRRNPIAHAATASSALTGIVEGLGSCAETDAWSGFSSSPLSTICSGGRSPA